MRAEELLADVAWLRRLAQRLVADEAIAEDLVQETWIAAVTRAPEARESRRPWLRKVLRDLWISRLRGEGRRGAREAESVAFADGVPTPEELVARAETGKLLAELVLELDEPFRGTVLLHFHEGLSLADIARAQDVPAGTVRWRLKTALDRVRERLDARDGGRRRWVAAVLGFSRGVMTVERTGRRIGIVVALLLLLLAGGALVGATRWGGGSGGGGDRPIIAAPANAPPAATPPKPAPRPTLPPVVGRVVAAGKPVAGAEVVLSELGGERATKSDAGGRFELPSPRRAGAVVHASARGYAAAIVAVEDAPGDLLLQLTPCVVTLYGTVTDSAGTPLPGAVIRRRAPLGPALRSDGKGRYELCAPRGTVQLSFGASGYGTIHQYYVAHGRHRLDAALVPEGIVDGRVVDAVGGAPLAGVRVVLSPVVVGPSGPEIVGGETDDDGRFHIDGAAPGRYLVEATADEHVQAQPLEVAVVAAATAPAVTLRLERGARVEGVVTAGGKPLGGAEVRLVESSRRFTMSATHSDADGRFSITPLRRGSQRTLSVLDQRVLTPDAPIAIDRDVVTVNVEVERGAMLTGVVRGLDGAPAPRAEVSLDCGLTNVHRTTDEEGRFSAAGFRGGPCTLRAAAADGSATSSLVDLELAADQRRDDVVVVLDRDATISGIVVDERGRPVEEIELDTTGPSGTIDNAMAVTTDGGRFVLGPLAGGTSYTLRLHPFRGARALLTGPDGREFPPVAVADGSTHVQDLRLVVELDPGEIAGVVLDGNGAPLADVAVRASPEPRPGVALDDGTQTPWPLARTGEDGRFRIAVRGAATYTVQAQASHDSVARVAGVAVGRRDVELRVAAPGAISGVLRGFGDDVAVIVHEDDRRYVARVEGGAFRVDGLGTGRYHLAAVDGDRRSATGKIEVRAGALARIELVATPARSIRGRAVNADGTAAAGMRCVVHEIATSEELMRDSAIVVSGADGGFVFPRVGAGRCIVRCGLDPYFGAGGVAFLGEGEDRELLVKIRNGSDGSSPR